MFANWYKSDSKDTGSNVETNIESKAGEEGGNDSWLEDEGRVNVIDFFQQRKQESRLGNDFFGIGSDSDSDSDITDSGSIFAQISRQVEYVNGAPQEGRNNKGERHVSIRFTDQYLIDMFGQLPILLNSETTFEDLEGLMRESVKRGFESVSDNENLLLEVGADFLSENWVWVLPDGKEVDADDDAEIPTDCGVITMKRFHDDGYQTLMSKLISADKGCPLKNAWFAALRTKGLQDKIKNY